MSVLAVAEIHDKIITTAENEYLYTRCINGVVFTFVNYYQSEENLTTNGQKCLPLRTSYLMSSPPPPPKDLTRAVIVVVVVGTIIIMIVIIVIAVAAVFCCCCCDFGFSVTVTVDVIAIGD